ncbi:MAG: hypothetical protein GXY77_18505 [Fibrobacter sp.]|nr:hypothetical protein [Fibrobacter sp.]
MKKIILMVNILLWNITYAFEGEEIINMLREYCEFGVPIENFQDVENVINKNINPEMTADEVENILLKMAEKEYMRFEEDTTQHNTVLFCVTEILGTYKSKKTDVFLKKLYKTGNSRLMKMTLDYMILKSDEWFQCSKNIIDSMGNDKYNYTFRISFYRNLLKLLKIKQKNESKIDSLKYIIYYALENEHWGHVMKLESEYTLIEPDYAKSKQRLRILNKFENKDVKKFLNIRKEKLKTNSKYELYKDIEIAYNTYLKLKKEKDLKNYSPPILSSK